MKIFKIFILFFTLSLTINIVNTFCADDTLSVIWRFAGKHEYGDLEPSDFCYVAIKDNILLMHWKSLGDIETIGIYSINKKDANEFCATKTITYVADDSKENSYVITKDKVEIENGMKICGKISNNKLEIKQLTKENNKETSFDWVTLDKEEAFLQYAFPKQILEKHFNWISPW